MLILALCGSLRAVSKNRRALATARALAPAGVEVRIWEGLGDLPWYSPDIDRADIPLPRAVLDFFADVDKADGLLIACPEYAHGIPGAFKNALDWLVGSVIFPGKPVALVNVAPHAVHARAALQEVLATMSALLVENACCTIAYPQPDRPDMEDAFATAIRAAVTAFAGALVEKDALPN